MDNGSSDKKAAAAPKKKKVFWTEKDKKYIVLSKEASKNQVKKIKHRYEKSYEWVCLACCRGIKEAGLEYHITSEIHQLAIEDCEINEKLSKMIYPSKQHISCLDEFAVRTSQKVSAALNNQISVRQKIPMELEALIQKELPDVDVSIGLHGSSLSEFAMVTSDVNLNVVIPGSDLNKELPALVMNKLVDLLEKKTTVYRKVKADFFSFNKIPRLLFEHKESKLRCEVRINVGSPKSLSLLLYCYRCLDSRVLQLGAIFRYWAKMCRVDCQLSGHYPGHVFYILAIHFLQQRRQPVIPVLHEMFPSLLNHEDSSDGDYGGYVTEQVVHEILDKLKAWQSPNSEPVGLLWHNLLKYYTVDFKIDRFAVSILQLKLIDRTQTQWGNYRLAVEDPNIPRSNVARAASSDRVFAYLRSCLKKTMVYFNSFDTLVSKQQPGGLPPCESSGSIGLEDECIVYATKKSAPSSSVQPSVPDNTDSPHGPILSGQPGSSSLESIGHDESVTEVERKLSSLVIVDSEEQLYSSAPQQLCPSSVLKDQDISSIGLPTNSPAEVVESNSSKFELLKEKVVFHSYPVTCLSCKKLNHNVLNCPTDELPHWKLSEIQIPPKEFLWTIRDAFKKYRKEVSPNPQDVKARAEICSMIESILRKSTIPDAELELFGSSANGFGTYYSDLDICLRLPYSRLQQMTKSDKNELIEKVARELARYVEFHKVFPITTARVPIVKFYLPKYKQECDVSLCNYLALRNTGMILAYATLDDRAKLLGYAVKHFAKVCDMGDASAGSLSSYAYILMVIHYLQRTDPPVLPCLQKIFPPNYKKVNIDNWNCYYFEDLPALHNYWPLHRNTESVGQLWLGFLKFFLSFDWAKEVVTIRQLEPLYKFDKWWMGKHMCIEDPFDLDHNLASSIGSKMRTYILERFYAALCFNTSPRHWKNIDDIMDPRAIVGGEHAPKFLLCHICSRRGHKAEYCPDKKMKKTGKGPRRSQQHGTPGRQELVLQSADQSVFSQIPPFQTNAQNPGTSPLTPSPFPVLPSGASPPLTPGTPHSLSPSTSLVTCPPLLSTPQSSVSVQIRDGVPVLMQGSHPHALVQVISSPQRPIPLSSGSNRHSSLQQQTQTVSQVPLQTRHYQDGLVAHISPPAIVPNMVTMNPSLPGFPGSAYPQSGLSSVALAQRPPSSMPLIQRPPSSVPLIQRPHYSMPLIQRPPSSVPLIQRPHSYMPLIQRPPYSAPPSLMPVHMPARPATAVPYNDRAQLNPLAYGQHPQQLGYPLSAPPLLQAPQLPAEPPLGPLRHYHGFLPYSNDQMRADH